MGYLDSEGLAHFWAAIKDRLPGPRGPAGPDGNPIGTVISFMGTTAPKDYLVCDGAAHNVADYPELAAFFQEQFGAANHFGGDGTTTFAVPDMRNLFLRGYHGEAEEPLSGEIGERQDATQHAAFGGHGSLWTASSLNSYLPLNLDSKEFKTSNLSATLKTEPSLTMQLGHYTSRPVNMAVLYCIKTV